MQTSDNRSQTYDGDAGTLPAAVEIRPFRATEDSEAFRILNEEWITKHFVMEDKDREVLNDPQNTILGKGGHIFIACIGSDAVGCIALIPMGGDVYEVSKMAVSPQLRGLGIGRKLLEQTLTKAKAIGAKSLFLGSSTKLKNAVHLYESIGFQHVPPEEIPTMPYTRADVFMEMRL